MSKTLRALGGEAATLTAAQFGSLFISFLATIIITRTLGPEARGAYAWVLTLQGIAVQVATIVTYTAVRKLAAEQPLSQSGSLVGTILMLSALGSLLAVPLFLYGWFEPTVGIHYQTLLVIAFIGVPTSAAVVSVGAVVHMRHHPPTTLATLILPRVMLLALTWMFLLTHTLNIITATWLTPLIPTFALGYVLTCLPVSLRQCIPSLNLAKRLVGFIGISWVAGLTIFALPKIALLRLGQLATLADTGHYSIAATLMEVALILPFSAGSVLTSHFSRLRGSGPRARLMGTLAITGFMAVTCAIGALLAGFLIPLVFGGSFAPAVTPFRWLMLAVVLASLHQGLSSHLYTTGPTRAIWLPPLIACAATFAFAETLIPRLGTTGAAFSTIGGYAVLIVGTMLLSKQKIIKA